MHGSSASQPVRPADVERLALLCVAASAVEIRPRVGFSVLGATLMVALLLPVLPLGRVVGWVGALGLCWGAWTLIHARWQSGLRNLAAARRTERQLLAVNLGSGLLWGGALALPGPLADGWRFALLALLVAVSAGSALRFLTTPRAWIAELLAIWSAAAVALLAQGVEDAGAWIAAGAALAGFVGHHALRLREVALDGFRLRLRNEQLLQELLGEQDHSREAWARVREQAASLSAAQEQLAMVSGRDDLTGALNRRRFLEELEGALAASRAGGRPFALAVVDLDQFRAFNERFGAVAGDQMLASAARALLVTTRGSDAVGRLAGEEFGVIVRGVGEEAMAAVAERIGAACAAARIGNPQATVTAAVGLVGHRAADNATELLRQAHLLMEQARRAGSGQCRVYVGEGSPEPTPVC